jgi:hypothetical protein
MRNAEEQESDDAKFLRRGLELGEGFQLYVVSVDSPDTREDVIDGLKESPALDVKVVRGNAIQGGTLITAIVEALHGRQDLKGRPVAIVTDLDELAMVEPRILTRLNEQRNEFIRAANGAVVMIGGSGLADLVRKSAPDTWSVRAADFYLTQEGQPRTGTPWRRIDQAFDGNETLFGRRSDELYCEREHSPFEKMRLTFRADLDPPRPPIAFLAGQRGCGKSTMLLRLLESFKDDYFVVYLDIEHHLDSNTVHQVDLLYLLGASVFQTAVRESLNPDVSYLRELYLAVDNLATRRESVNVADIVSRLGGIGPSAFRESFGEQAANDFTNHFYRKTIFPSGVPEETLSRRESEPRIQQIVNAVNLVIAEVKTRSQQDLLIVVDGLDKLQRLEQSKRLFLDSDSLTGPVCRIIYTAPMNIFTDPRFSQIEQRYRSFLCPNINLHEKKSKRRRQEGYDTLSEVVSRRLRTIDLKIEDLFEGKALELLMMKSGGILRGFIELIREASASAQILGLPKISLKAVREAVQSRSSKLGLRLNEQSVAELRRIRKHHLATEGGTAELLQNLLAIAYVGDTVWFDAHPLLWEILDE